MKGGLREGAGRKRLPNSQKKKGKNIYLSEELIEKIDSMDIRGAKTFSQKCIYLINEGIEKEELKLRVEDEKIKITEKKRNPKYLRFIDLFAGIGGIRLGFEDNNTECVFSSEWDKYAQRTYEANFHEIPAGDITKIKAEDIPEHDVLLAGFPCQPFSSIGKREGFEHPTQGTLFFDVVRIIDYHKPKAFLLENVKGLLTSDNGRTFKIIIQSLKDLGYDVYSDLLDAQNFGLPQSRERVIIVGFRKGLCVKDFKIPTSNGNPKVPVKDILEDEPTGKYGEITEHLQKSYLFKKDDGRPQIVDNNSNFQVKTLCASYHKIQRLTGTFVRGGSTGIRLFSETECKRLMGFPDDFVIPVSRTQMYRQFGNSVAVPMIREVADKIKEVLYEKGGIEKGDATF